VIGSIRVSCKVGRISKIVRRKVQQVALQVDFRVGQLLAMNPDSPLGVSREGGYQNTELRV